MDKRILLIIGGSSGIGYECAKIFSNNNEFCVLVSSRTACDLPTVHNFFMDITSDESIKESFGNIMAKYGRIDILINCAGSGIGGAVENIPYENGNLFQMNINFSAPANVCKHVVPFMRQQNGGKIINVGSLASFFPLPFQAYYSSSKAALNSFSLALRNELKPFHISVSCVHPGDTKTSFTANRKVFLNNNYMDMDMRSIKKMEADEQKGMSAHLCAKSIYKHAVKKNPPAMKIIGGFNKLLYMLFKFMPASLVVFAMRKLYCPTAKPSRT